LRTRVRHKAAFVTRWAASRHTASRMVATSAMGTHSLIPYPHALAASLRSAARSTIDAASVLDRASCTAAILEERHLFHADEDYYATECPKPSQQMACGTQVNGTVSVCSTGSSFSWISGPFSSTGGYDYWSLTFTDNSTLTGVPPGSAIIRISLTAHDADAASPSEAILGLPPLHFHHSVLGRHGITSESAQFALLAMASGDSTGSPDGHHPYVRNLISHGFYLPHPALPQMQSGVLLNDVREMGSPPLRWYINLTVSFASPAELAAQGAQPVEYVQLNPANRKGSALGTYDVPKDEDSFIVVQGAWPATGLMLGDPDLSYFHAHQAKFHYSVLYAGTPEQLGLDGDAYRSSSGCDVVVTREAGFGTNMAMIERMAKDPRLKAHQLCNSTAQPPTIDNGIAYDRLASLVCTPLRFRVNEGEPFTFVTFYGPRTLHDPSGATFNEKVGMLAPGASSTDMFPEHATWNFFVVGTYPIRKLDEIATKLYPMISVGPVNTTRCNVGSQSQSDQPLPRS